jgi:tetratricopeptide (TPR) repeat protein
LDHASSPMVKISTLIAVNIVLSIIIVISFREKLLHFDIDLLNERSNYLQSQDLFALEIGNRTPCASFWLKQWHRYFKDVIHRAPQLIEAQSLEGFYLTMTHQDAAAIKAFETANMPSPKFWVNAHNLGILYLRQKNFSQALDFFQQAAQIDIHQNAYIIANSKLYGDLIRRAKGMNINLEERLKFGMKQNLLGIRVATYALQTGQLPAEINLYPILF